MTDGPLAARVPAADWADLLACGVPAHFPLGRALFRQGDADRRVYVVRRGAVKVVRAETDGGEAVLGIRRAGDVLGDMSALDQGVRSATVVALSAVVAQVVSAAQFRDFVARPSVAFGFALYTVQRLRDADVQLCEIAVLPVRVRLARALLRLAEDSVVRLSQQDIAGCSGASRNAVVEELTALRARGVLDTRRQAVIILDTPALRRVAELDAPER